MSLRLALYQPDIAQNAGTLMRLCACMNVAMDVIEPCGFVMADKHLKRSGMDYLDGVDLTRHADWAAFQGVHSGARRILLTTKSQDSFVDFTFRADDILLLGRESAGVPDDVHNACDARITIPMSPQMRSLNVAIAGAMVLSEALRQTDLFPR